MSERRLASVQQIESVQPIAGADRLELVKFEGLLWQSVVPKGKYSVGDMVVMYEYDSVLPEDKARELGVKRVKPVRLRGVLSQVLIEPLGLNEQYKYKVGEDVTDLFGVTKYEPQQSVGSFAGDMLPSGKDLFKLGLVPKTAQLRLQSYPELYDEVTRVPYYVTQKLDGTSATFAVLNSHCYTGSRNHFLSDSQNLYAKYAAKHRLFDKIIDLGLNIAIQGELCGPKINSNPLTLPAHELFVYRVWDIDKQKYLHLHEMETVCKDLGLHTAPIQSLSWPNGRPHTIDELIDIANGQVYQSGCFGEGIVVSRQDHQSSFKIISDNYV